MANVNCTLCTHWVRASVGLVYRSSHSKTAAYRCNVSMTIQWHGCRRGAVQKVLVVRKVQNANGTSSIWMNEWMCTCTHCVKLFYMPNQIFTMSIQYNGCNRRRKCVQRINWDLIWCKNTDKIWLCTNRKLIRSILFESMSRSSDTPPATKPKLSIGLQRNDFGFTVGTADLGQLNCISLFTRFDCVSIA